MTNNTNCNSSETIGGKSAILDIFFLLLGSLLIVLIYSGAFGISFVQDDWTYLQQATQGRAQGNSSVFLIIRDAFVVRSGEIYRPVENLYFSIGYQLFGLTPLKWHLFNMICFLMVGVAYFFFLAEIGCSRPVIYLSYYLFTISWVNFRVLYWICLFRDIAVVFFLLAATLAYIKYRKGRGWYWGIVAIITYIMGLLFKEHASLLPLVLLSFELLNPGRKNKISSKQIFSVVLPLVIFFCLMVMYMLFQYHHAHSYKFPAYKMGIGWHVLVNANHNILWAASNDDGLSLIIIALSFAGLILATRKKNRSSFESESGQALFGLIWFGLFLAPFLLMIAHEYVYHQFLARAGFTLFVAASLNIFVKMYTGQIARKIILFLFLGLLLWTLKDNMKKIIRMNDGGETISWMSSTTWQNLEEVSALKSRKINKISILCDPKGNTRNSCQVLAAIQQGGLMFRLYFGDPEFEVSYQSMYEKPAFDTVYYYKDGKMFLNGNIRE